jgi:hypothetical protein
MPRAGKKQRGGGARRPASRDQDINLHARRKSA